MKRENHEEACELCLNYVTGECSNEEQQVFERHLPDCLECQSELKDLRTAWDALPAEMEIIEPPKDLKNQVMDAVTSTEAVNRNKPSYRRPFRIQIWAGSAAAVLALIFGLLWSNLFTGNQTTAMIPLEQALSVSASQIDQLIQLNPATYENSSTNPYGIACIVNNGHNKQFVIYVFGAPETTGDQAYQVWITDGNQRNSAGTFRVDEQGVGLLAMPIASSELTFDRISISLEPDDQGSEPRGVKVLESES